jgi:hypothetical protein
MDIRYELGPFQNPPKMTYGPIWASALELLILSSYDARYMARDSTGRKDGDHIDPDGVAGQEIDLPVWPDSACHRFNLKAFPSLKSLFFKKKFAFPL